jgi:tRNA pseudouridine55 synthase/H/ACA ribonucleoprotein complex subunit 4
MEEIAMTDTVEPAGPEKVHLWSGSGIIVLDKPKGPSSHEVAAWVGKMLGCPVGHSGTLDPQVSGLLLIMLGNAVRLAPLLLQHDKEYVCLMRLHGDADPERICQVAGEFTGRLYQRPPRKSAVKRNLRIRTILEMEILGIEGRLVLFRAKCDAGTYIRSLCHHMGLALGVGGHMQELRRTRSGTFVEEDMHTLHEIQDAAVAAREGDRSALVSMVLPVDRSIPDIPTIVVRDTAIDAVCHGAVLAGVGIVSCMPFERGQTVVLLSQKNEFIGLGRALVASSGFTPGQTGLVAAPTTVFMAAGTYPRGWTKSETAVPRERKPKTTPAAGAGKSPGKKPASFQKRNTSGRQDNRFWRKR